MKKFIFNKKGTFVYALVVAAFTAAVAFANSVTTPNLPIIGDLQSGDLMVGTRTGVTYNMRFNPSVIPAGAVTLGSSTTANPFVTGDPTSGFYSSGFARVDVSISGKNVTEWSPSGLGFTTTSAPAGSFTGIHSLSANALSFSTSGVDRATISASGVQTNSLNSSALSSSLTGTVIRIANANATQTRFEADAFGAAAFFTGVRADGTAASPTTLQANDEISGINSYGYNGAAFAGPQASVRAYAAAAWTTTGNGTYVDVATTPTNSTTMASVARFNADGGVTVPPTVTGGDEGAGTINASGIYINGVAVSTGSSSINLGSITTTNPHISADLTSGFYTAGAGEVDVGIGGTNAAKWTTSGATFANTTTVANLTITGTCTGCGAGGSPGGSGTAVQYKNGSSFGGATGLFYSTSRGGLDSLSLVTTSNFASNGNSGADLTSIAIGGSALLVNTATTGRDNAVGNNSLAALTTGTDNTAIGYNAGTHLTIDGYNTVVGSQALATQAAAATTSSNANTAIGVYALTNLTTGTSNVAIGALAGSSVTVGVRNVIIGALSATASALSTGTDDVIIGNGASTQTVGASNSVVIGSAANGSATDVSIGYQAYKNAALVANSNTNNVNIGYQAGASNGFVGSTNVGYQAASSGAGTGNTGIGFKANQAQQGFYNTAVGYAAMYQANSAGVNAFNTAVGVYAGQSITTGKNNTIVGANGTIGNSITTGSSNLMLGNAVGNSTLTTGSSNILIGTSSGVTTPAAGTSNYLNIGNMIAGDTSKGILIFEGPATTPTCGTSPSLATGSNDMIGEVTVGTSSSNSCIITFANTHTQAPRCVVTNQTNTVVGFAYSISTTALTVSATSGLDSSKFDYFCPTGSTATNPTP